LTALKVLRKMQTLNGHQEYVFLRPQDGRPMADHWVQHEFYKLTDKAGIEDLHFHDLRRTFGCTMVDLGVDLLTVKNAMAHKSIQSTMRYIRPSENKTDEAFDRIGDFWANGSKKEVKSVFEAEPISPLTTLKQVS
jgi:integrase